MPGRVGRRGGPGPGFDGRRGRRRRAKRSARYGQRVRRLAPRVGALVAAVFSAVLVGPALPAAASPDPPEPTSGPAMCTVEMPPVSSPFAPASPPMAVLFPPVVVCTVEVPMATPVVVGDRATELTHLGVAAGLGAVVAAGATVARLRRRPPPRDAVGVGPDDRIDLTDIVQSPAAA
jgi:hypothetical protein